MSIFRHHRIAPILMGVLLVAGGLGIVGNGLYQRWRSGQEVATRTQTDHSAVGAWKNGGSNKLAGAPVAPAAGTPATTAPGAPTPVGCGGAADPQAYALVQFTSLAQYGYAGVSGDGDWDSLHDRSMVHWKGSAEPGGVGNMIVAFHREPNYEHIDQLDKGGIITIQDLKCHTFEYRVTQRWELTPENVTQLTSTTGHDLTLITCTPWWQDYNRYVWRATLVSVDGQAFTA